ncbi:MAG: Mur ligase family protein [Hyphomicrobiales bacterium]|nr:Mur ligase family protein [Hyphomicrobiales bacterium]
MRRRCGRYIGVTGSCGKTTTTFLAGELLKSEGSTYAVVRNNLARGVIRFLAHLDHRVDFMIQEISGDTPGNIAGIASIVRPDVAVVTAVGHDHFSNFRDVIVKGDGEVPVSDRYLAAIAAEKASLVSGLKPRGIACLNGDDPRVRAMADLAPGRVVLFGVGDGVELRAVNVAAVWPRRLTFDLIVNETVFNVQTRFVGTVALHSVLAALAVIHAVGGDLARAIDSLATLEPFDQRMSVHYGIDRHTYLADTRKAPHWQVEKLLDDLPSIQAKPLVFVLGEISDTRNDKSSLYRKLLRRASGLADHVVGFGPAASNARKVAAQGFRNVVAIDTHEQAAEYLASLTPSVVLLKSNKTAKLARIMTLAALPKPVDSNRQRIVRL